MLFKHISKGRNCPQCKSGEVFRVKRTGTALKFICNITNLRPHWCPNCDTRFLAPRQLHPTRVTEDLDLSDKSQRKGSSRPEQERLAH